MYIDKIKVINHIGTGRKHDWNERKDLILNQCIIFNDIEKLIAKAKNNELSLAVFKPSTINAFKYKKDDTEWDQKKLKKVKAQLAQRNLFDEASFDHYFKIMPKLPYKFSYEFEDINGKKCNLMITDWEIGQLYWNCLKNNNNNESIAINDVKKKYYDNFAIRKDLYFFLGTTGAFHDIAPNPFIIIGTFHPPKVNQMTFNFQ